CDDEQADAERTDVDHWRAGEPGRDWLCPALSPAHGTPAALEGVSWHCPMPNDRSATGPHGRPGNPVCGTGAHRLSGIFGEITYAILSSLLDSYEISVYFQGHGDS